MSAFGFLVRKGHISLYRSLDTNIAKSDDQFNLRKYLGVSDLSGMSSSSSFVLLSETDHKIICMSVCVTMSKKSI